MNISLFQLVNLLLALILTLLMIKYVWDMFYLVVFQPMDWQRASKDGKISHGLAKSEKRFKDKVRFFTWWFQVERLKECNVEGAFAELGVYKGESAKVIHLMDPNRRFYLFDTYSGFIPEDLKGETGEAATYTESNFSDTDLEKVVSYIGGNDNLRFVQGRFQDTCKEADNEVFALVNLDADLYHPTIDALHFFYLRLSPGGAIFIHDYNYKWAGIKKAVDEFAATIPEPLIKVADTQGTILIVKSAKK
jgi:O-methyltransferase